uniref:PTHB1 N-terminal domain-containing protein n=1 Tax=Timema monikensis TaxID=170555 RepID=A0A7R9HSN6_9NEOP|nr:unnamed protein product [Timema monikensis]
MSLPVSVTRVANSLHTGYLLDVMSLLVSVTRAVNSLHTGYLLDVMSLLVNVTREANSLHTGYLLDVMSLPVSVTRVANSLHTGDLLDVMSLLVSVTREANSLHTGFSQGSQMVQLCVLHPRSVAVYSLVTKSGAAEHGDQNCLVLAYEHYLRRSSFCMVLGPFGGAHSRDFICVQSLDGTLSFFEQETFAFTRFLPGFLLPGILVFLSRTDSFITIASNYNVESYRWQERMGDMMFADDLRV